MGMSLNTRADNIKLLEELAHEKGLRAEGVAVLKRIMNNESSGETNPKSNGRSSAKGLFQFIDGTWAGLVNKHPDELKKDGRDDPRQQIIAAIYFTKSNELAFKRRFDRTPDDGERYLMHFAGEDTALRVIRLAEIDPNTPIQNVMSQKAIEDNGYKSEANKGVRINFKDGGFLPIESFKVGDFVNWANGKMGLPDNKYKTDSSPQYKRDKRGVPDSQGNWIMVAIAAVAAVVAAVAMFSDDEPDDGNLKSPSTPRRPRGHSPSPA